MENDTRGRPTKSSADSPSPAGYYLAVPQKMEGGREETDGRGRRDADQVGVHNYIVLYIPIMRVPSIRDTYIVASVRDA